MNEQTKKIFEDISPIIIEILGINRANLNLESRFKEDLSADSLSMVELTMKLEEKYKLEIPDEDASKLLTIGDTIKYIKEKSTSPYKN